MTDTIRFKGRTRDENGRVVSLIDPMPSYVLGRRGSIEADRLEVIVEALEPGARDARRQGRLAALIVLPLIVLGLGTMIVIEGRPAWDDLVSTLVSPALLPVWIGAVLVPIMAARQKRLRRVREVMLRHHSCPHCGYDLRGTPAGANGHTICPECACAWSLDVGTESTSTAPAHGRHRWMVVLAVVGMLVGIFVCGLFVYLRMR